MHLVHGVQGAQGAGHIEHGREFGHYPACLGQEQGKEQGEVGGAVVEEHRFAPRGAAACGVEVDEVDGLHVRHEVLARSLHHLGMRHTEQGKVVARQGAELLLTFDVGGAAEDGGHETEVDAHAACDVGHGSGLGSAEACCQLALVGRGLLPAALLESQAGRKEHALGVGPAGHLVAQALPALHLAQNEGHVDVGAAGQLECEAVGGRVAIVGERKRMGHDGSVCQRENQ